MLVFLQLPPQKRFFKEFSKLNTENRNLVLAQMCYFWLAATVHSEFKFQNGHNDVTEKFFVKMNSINLPKKQHLF